VVSDPPGERGRPLCGRERGASGEEERCGKQGEERFRPAHERHFRSTTISRASPAATSGVSAEPSVAPTPVPAPTPFTYKVKAGDTLSGIAAKYKVSVDDILAANPDLKDPNQLQVGQVLVIPLPASSVIPDAGTSEVTPAP